MIGPSAEQDRSGEAEAATVHGDRFPAGVSKFSLQLCGEAGELKPSIERSRAECTLIGGDPVHQAILDERAGPDEREGRLLEQLAAGDRAAFWELWQLHRSYLFGICAKHAGGINEEAEDVLSRAMLRAFEKMPAYAARINSPKAWLTRLTINLCVDMFRESRRRSSKTTNLDDLTGGDVQPASSTSDSPEEALLRLEVQSRLNSALSDLPAQVRGPFVLHFTEGVPCEDVGKAFSITAANVRKRIQRARYLLRQKLDPVGGCRLQVGS